MIKNYFPNLFSEKISLLERLAKEVIEWNKKINLVSFKDEKELVVKHFVDCGSLVEALGYVGVADLPPLRVLDLGTGGGFPGLVLAILKPEAEFTLMDATRKKIEVLKNIIGKLGLKNVACIVSRAEELAHDSNFRESFDFVVARAVAKLPVLLELACGFVKVGGFFIAYKGPSYKEEIDMSLQAASILGFKFAEVKEYELPEGFGKRALLVYRKEREAEKKYPRRVGMPRKKPLGMKNV